MTATERQLRDEIAELGEQIDRSEEAYAGMRADRDRVQLLADARQRKLDGAVKALGEVDVLINEVLDQWTWPIRSFGDMRSWLGRLSDAVKRGQGHAALAPPSSQAPKETT